MIELLAKSELSSIEVVISKVLIDSNISHDEFVLVNNVPKENDHMKKEITDLKIKRFIEDFSLVIKQS